MAHRLLPFRQYDENDVVNLYSLDANSLSTSLKLMDPNDDGANADGVLVKVTEGNMNLDTVDVGEDGRFQGSYNSPVGRNPYPTNPLKVAPAGSGDAVLGVTLRQTLSVDENGESLLFNPVKKDELNAVLSGQTVPVLTKGVIAVHENGVGGDGDEAIGTKLAANAGKFVPAKSDGLDFAVIGTIIGTGSRGENKDNNYGGIRADQQSGKYYVIKLDC